MEIQHFVCDRATPTIIIEKSRSKGVAMHVYGVSAYYRIAGKSGGELNLAVHITTAKLKIRQNFLLAYIRMAILYRTAKFKSANILLIAIWGSTAKFNARPYFRLYGIQ